jgi:hypothetical protein
MHVPEHAQALTAAGLCELTVAAIGRKESPSRLRTAWLGALQQLAGDAGARAALVAAGAADAVEQACADAAAAGSSDEEMAAAAAAAALALQQG